MYAYVHKTIPFLCQTVCHQDEKQELKSNAVLGENSMHLSCLTATAQKKKMARLRRQIPSHQVKGKLHNRCITNPKFCNIGSFAALSPFGGKLCILKQNELNMLILISLQ